MGRLLLAIISLFTLLATQGIFFYAGWMQPELKPAPDLPLTFSSCKQAAVEEDDADTLCRMYYALIGSREISNTERGYLMFLGTYSQHLANKRDGLAEDGILDRYWYIITQPSNPPGNEQLQYDACMLRAYLNSEIPTDSSIISCLAKLHEAMGVPLPAGMPQ